MTSFESSVKQIPYPQENVYRTLSDLNNLSRVKDKIPAEKAESLSFTQDEVAVDVPPVGKVSMRIIEREEPKTIKFESVNSPLQFNFWIQLLPVTAESSKLKLTIHADIPFFAKGMVSGPLQDAIEKIADMMAAIPYNG